MLKKLNTWKRNDKKIDEARKKLNDSVGLGRRDSIEYLAPGASGRAVRKVEVKANKFGPPLEYEAGVLRKGIAVEVQANDFGLGLILELAPKDGNVVIDIWEQGGISKGSTTPPLKISKFHNDIRPGDILAKVRKPHLGWIDCRHTDIGMVLGENDMLGTDPLEFGVLRLSDSEERADTSQVQAATTGAL